ncbi:MAG TPA: HAMP domain-containing protein [Candidatus Eisenbacteria bacterium]|nr:HAMP domain-containing protein [Candidatus Eisenbacteria bacterium]
MSQESMSMDGVKVGGLAAVPWKAAGLRWKISASFSALLLVLGSFVIGVVYYLTDSALRRQVELRASAIATNLSDAAAGHVARKNSLELDALIAKYGRLDGVAYAFIIGPKGDVIASSLQPFPAELKDVSLTRNQRVASSRTTSLRGQSAYETRVPLLDGQLGAVHVGLWAESVHSEVRATILPIVAAVALCLVIGVALSMAIAGKTIRPILDLKATADEISRGRLDTVVPVQSNDEVGELARSLERMRASLKAAMSRLNKA